MSGIHQCLKKTLLSLVPADGSAIGNTALRRAIEKHLAAEGVAISEADYWQAHGDLVASGALVKGQGRGGSMRRADGASPGFSLEQQAAPRTGARVAPRAGLPPALVPRAALDEAPQILSYRHPDQSHHEEKGHDHGR